MSDNTTNQPSAAPRVDPNAQQPRVNQPEPAAPAPDPEAEQRERDARFRNSRGAQVILDPESDASLAARGGAGGTIVENTFARDKHLLDQNLDPRDPDASHLPGNVVPAGGEIMDQVSEEHEPAFKPDPATDEKPAQ